MTTKRRGAKSASAQAKPSRPKVTVRRNHLDRAFEQEIATAAEYIRQRCGTKKTLRTTDDPHPLIADDEFLDPRKFRRRIEGIRKHVEAIDRATAKLEIDFAYGRLDPFAESEQYILRTRDLASSIFVALHNALFVTARPPATRAHWEQRSAVRLAEGICGTSNPGAVRMVARRIILKAKIDMPDERSISNWLKELRRENGK
jgi:hypothetical protein